MQEIPKHRDYKSPELQFMVHDYKEKCKEQLDVTEKLQESLKRIYELNRLEEEQRRLFQEREEEERRETLKREALRQLIADSVISNPQYPLVSGMWFYNRAIYLFTFCSPSNHSYLYRFPSIQF